MKDVLNPPADIEVVNAENVNSAGHEALTKMRAEEASSSGDDSFVTGLRGLCHLMLSLKRAFWARGGRRSRCTVE